MSLLKLKLQKFQNHKWGITYLHFLSFFFYIQTLILHVLQCDVFNCVQYTWFAPYSPKLVWGPNVKQKLLLNKYQCWTNIGATSLNCWLLCECEFDAAAIRAFNLKRSKEEVKEDKTKANTVVSIFQVTERLFRHSWTAANRLQ